MKRIPNISFVIALFAGLFLASCEKVIDVDLNSKDPQVVIEAQFTAGETTHRVSVTRTLNFDQEAPYPTVDNATITVIDNLGIAQSLTFVGNGIYEVTNYPVIEGRTYTLTVVANGNSYTASSTVPALVQIDSLYAQYFPFGTDGFNALIPLRTDPAGVANYYQFDLYRNGKRVSGIYLQDDQFTDGIVVEQPIFDNDGEFKSGDTAVVEMYGVDRPVYDYFYALLQNQTATPANPTSNFSGGCLGYFSARTKDVATTIIP